MPAPRWAVYMLRCGDGSLYTGITTDLRRRVAEHSRPGGRGARRLRGRAPLAVVFTRPVGSRSRALRLERLIKGLPKARKEDLARGGALPRGWSGARRAAPSAGR